MKAIIAAMGRRETSGEFGDITPAFLLPLVDRPFLQHVIEHAVESGVNAIDLILDHQAEQIERTLGDGTRWGISITYHLVAGSSWPYRLLQNLSHGEEILLGHAEYLPTPIFELPLTAHEVTAFSRAGRWMGWAWLNPAAVSRIQPDWDRVAFESFVSAAAGSHGRIVECPSALSADTEMDLIVSQRAALGKQFPVVVQFESRCDRLFTLL
jgi:hypothetical protein